MLPESIGQTGRRPRFSLLLRLAFVPLALASSSCGSRNSGAPEHVRAAPGDAFAEVRWSATLPATGYTVIVSPGGTRIEVTGTATRAHVTGLVDGTTYTFTVQSSTGAVSQPSNPVTPSPAANVIADVAFHPQERPLTCEEAALRMALEHEGIVVSEASLLQRQTMDPRPSEVDASGTLHWGNPYTSVVGDPDGSERALTGYGTYYPTIARVATACGASVLRAGESTEPDTIYAVLLGGHPVVAWVAYDWKYHPASMRWVTFDGAQLWWHGPFEHAVTLVGVTPTSVLVNNPMREADWEWVTKDDFEAAYRTFGDMAVILR